MLTGLQQQPACVIVILSAVCASYLFICVINLSTPVLQWLKLNTLTPPHYNLSPTFPEPPHWRHILNVYRSLGVERQVPSRQVKVSSTGPSRRSSFQETPAESEAEEEACPPTKSPPTRSSCCSCCCSPPTGECRFGSPLFQVGTKHTHTHSNTHWCTEEVRNVGKVWRGKDREGLGALRGGWMCLGGLFPGYMHNTIITEVLFQCGCSHLCSMYIDLYTHDWIGQNALLCRL